MKQFVGPCRLWLGSIDGRGYGRIWRAGKHYRAHRVAYETVNGPIPSGLVIDHLCCIKLCVNPEHMEVVTRRENTLRGLAPTAINARKQTCLFGHPFSGFNIRGNRICKTCDMLRARKYRRHQS